jgi:hypothetical protein
MKITPMIAAVTITQIMVSFCVIPFPSMMNLGLAATYKKIAERLPCRRKSVMTPD